MFCSPACSVYDLTKAGSGVRVNQARRKILCYLRKLAGFNPSQANRLVLPTKASRLRVNQANRVFLQCGCGGGLLTKLAGLGSRSRVFMAPWSRSRLRKKPGAEALEKNQKPEPPQKNMPLLYRLLEAKKHKQILHLILFFR